MFKFVKGKSYIVRKEVTVECIYPKSEMRRLSPGSIVLAKGDGSVKLVEEELTFYIPTDYLTSEYFKPYELNTDQVFDITDNKLVKGTYYLARKTFNGTLLTNSTDFTVNILEGTSLYAQGDEIVMVNNSYQLIRIPRERINNEYLTPTSNDKIDLSELKETVVDSPEEQGTEKKCVIDQ